MKRIRGPLLALSSILFFVLAAEAFWRIFPSAIPRSVEVLARARVYEIDRGVGIVLRPDVDTRVKIPWLERTVRIRTTGHGRPVGFRDDGLQGGPRVAILGDSYAFGYGVDQDESFPAQLERRLRERGVGADVINAGVPGFGALEERRMLEKHVLPLDPVLVLLAVYANDPDDNARSAHARWLGIRNFLGVHSVLYEALSAARAAHPRVEAARRGRLRPKDDRGVESVEGYEIERLEIGRMRDLCAARGIRFGVILLPDVPPLDEGALRPEGAAVAFLDLAPLFAGLPRRTWLNRYVGHLTPAANGRVADAIAAFIERRALLGAPAPPGPG